MLSSSQTTWYSYYILLSDKPNFNSVLVYFHFSSPFLSCILFLFSVYFFFPLLSPHSHAFTSSSPYPLPNLCLYLNPPSQLSPPNNSVMVELVCRAPSSYASAFMTLIVFSLPLFVRLQSSENNLATEGSNIAHRSKTIRRHSQWMQSQKWTLITWYLCWCGWAWGEKRKRWNK